MKPTILAAVIAASLLWSWAPARQSCTAQACAPAAVPALAGQVSLVRSNQPVPPRPRVERRRDCVGFPRRAPVSPQDPGPVMVVTSELLSWA
jgi:hypothetical protein